MLFEHSRFPEVGLHALAVAGSERSSEFGLACEPYESGAERFGVAGGREQPSPSSPTASRTPATSVPATARPAAMHSSSAFGQPSARELRTPASTALRRPATSSTSPAKRTEPSRPRSRTNASTGWRSPSSRPASTRTADVPSSSKDVAAARQARTSVAWSLALVEVRERAHDDVAIVRSQPRSPLGPARTCARQRHAVPDDGHAVGGAAQLVDEMGGRVARVRDEHRRVPRGTSREPVAEGEGEGRPADSRCKWSLRCTAR